MSLGPIAKRRYGDRHHAQSVEEIGPEPAGLDLGLEIPVGGADDPCVDLEGVFVTDPFEGAVLKNSEELHLHLWTQLTDLVEEDRAAVCELESALLVSHCAGKGSLDVSEKFAFEQTVGQGAAVDRHEKSVGPPAGFVKGVRDELFSGAALALNQNRHIEWADLPNRFEEFLHLRIRPDHPEGRRVFDGSVEPTEPGNILDDHDRVSTVPDRQTVPR